MSLPPRPMNVHAPPTRVAYAVLPAAGDPLLSRISGCGRQKPATQMRLGWCGLSLCSKPVLIVLACLQTCRGGPHLAQVEQTGCLAPPLACAFRRAIKRQQASTGCLDSTWHDGAWNLHESAGNPSWVLSCHGGNDLAAGEAGKSWPVFNV